MQDRGERFIDQHGNCHADQPFHQRKGKIENQQRFQHIADRGQDRLIHVQNRDFREAEDAVIQRIDHEVIDRHADDRHGSGAENAGKERVCFRFLMLINQPSDQNKCRAEQEVGKLADKAALRNG